MRRRPSCSMPSPRTIARALSAGCKRRPTMTPAPLGHRIARVPLLAVENVSRHFGGIVALQDVSLSIDDGEIVGLLGANGAGKTTSFNVITLLYSPASGSVAFDGQDLLKVPASR